MPTPSLEERVEALETELRTLRASLKPERQPSKIPWRGIVKDGEMFEEVLRLGREWRKNATQAFEDEIP